MRVNKFLAAVAIPATFAACTQEELFVAENVPVDMAMEEVVGYRTIGTDVTFSASSTGDETRMSATGNWEKTDQIGLGWLVYGNPQDEQTQVNKPIESKLWANHQFVWNGEEFATQGNVYEGWYFAYYPWSYEKRAGVTKFVEVNPAQKSKVWKDRLSQNLHMSTLQFIGAKNMDDNNKITTPIQLRNAVNNLIVTSTPAKGSAFAKDGQLNDLAIESIKINVDQEVFASWLTLYPRMLSTTEEGFNASLKDAMKAFKSDMTTSGRENSITTNVTEAGFVTGETANMVTIVAPYAPTTALDATEVSIEINVAGGKFEIAYTADAEDGTTAAKNNVALETLATELSAGGKLTAPQTSANPYAMVNVELNDANFRPNFDNISNIDQWIAAVELADKLDRKDLVFTVTDNIEFTADKGIVDGTIVAPVNGVGVIAKAGAPKLVIKGETSWNQNIKSVDVVGITVDANGVLDVDGLVAASSFVNNGIINASKNAILATHGAGFINNGRVNVEYGAEVRITNLTACASGHIIAYEVDEKDAAEYTKIANLAAISGNKKHAFVNTLVFDKNFNLEQKGTLESTESDPYKDITTPGTPGETVGTGLNIEATGAIVEGPATIKVKNVTLTNATLKGVEVEGSVSATGSVISTTKAITGDVTATNSEIIATAINGKVTATNGTIDVPTISGNVELAGEVLLNGVDAKSNVTVLSGTTKMDNVNINGTLTVNKGANVVIGGEDAKVDDINNYGTLTTFVEVYTTTVAVHKGATATIADGKTIWYTEPNAGTYGYIQEGTTNGRILYLGGDDAGNVVLVSSLEQLQAALDAAAEGTTTIALTGDIKAETAAVVSQKEGVNIIIDGQNHQYEGIINIDGDSRSNGTETLHIKNINFYTTLETDVDFISAPQEKDEPYNYAHNITVEKCNFTGNGIAAKVGMRFHTAFNIKVKDCTAENVHSLVQAISSKRQTYENCTVTSASEGGINFQNSAQKFEKTDAYGAVVKNCNITAGDYGVRIQATSNSSLSIEGSTINAPRHIVLRNKESGFTLNNPSNIQTFDADK